MDECRLPVVRIILSRLPTTLLLMLTAFSLSTTAGIALGALAARRPHTATDASILSLACAVTPCPSSGWPR